MHPKAFMSHSSADKVVVRRLATDLRSGGVDAWFDEWEIRPGDSIVDRVNSGLKDCSIFLIVISQNSVASKWVREELNAAVIKRIQQDATLIPVRLDASEVPPLLTTLHYVDLADYQAGLNKLLDAIFQRDVKPPLGIPATTSANPFGLSNSAVKVATILFSIDTDGLHGNLVAANQLLPQIGLPGQEAEDALLELADMGFAKVERYMGGALIGPTHKTAFVLAGSLNYNPESDVVAVAKVIAPQSHWISGQDLQQATALDLPRLNRAVRVMEEQQLLEVLKALGTTPFAFVQVRSNYATRKFLKEQA